MKTRYLILPLLLLPLAACSGSSEHYSPDVTPAPFLPPLAQAPVPPVSAQPLTPPPPRDAGMLTLAGIGSYMDAQETELRNRLRGTGALVLRPGDDIVVVLRNDQLLEGMNVSGTGQKLLGIIASVFRYYDRSAVQIQGFTDTTGTPERNLELSDARAKTIYNVLLQQGVSGGRLSAQGFGETRLRVSTGDNTNEPRNRRIELRIIARPG